LTIIPFIRHWSSHVVSRQCPAGDYLAALRDCTARALAEDGSICNDNNEDIGKQTKSAASTAGDKAVYQDLNDWDDMRAWYNIYAGRHSQKDIADFKHLFEVCSNEVEIALRNRVAPEKSQCEDLIYAE
jgi:hypothetical protein